MRKNTGEVKMGSIGGCTEGYFFNGEKYTGTVYWEFDDIIGSEFEVKDGLKHGLEQEFLADGRVTSAINYEEGQEEGIGKYFYESGKLKEEIFYEQGLPIWSNTYDEDGNLTERYDINKDSFEYKTVERYREARKEAREKARDQENGT